MRAVLYTGRSTVGATRLTQRSFGGSRYQPIDAQRQPPRPPPAGHDMRRGLGTYDSGSDSDDPEVDIEPEAIPGVEPTQEQSRMLLDARMFGKPSNPDDLLEFSDDHFGRLQIKEEDYIIYFVQEGRLKEAHMEEFRRAAEKFKDKMNFAWASLVEES